MAYNPSLFEEPRSKRATVLARRQAVSILDWLEESGRLLARDTAEYDYGEDEEEINELMSGEDNSFDLDDDDDDLDLEE